MYHVQELHKLGGGWGGGGYYPLWVSYVFECCVSATMMARVLNSLSSLHSEF